MDVEILVPIDHEFNETEEYKFKPEIQLMNCLKDSYKGNPQGFNNAVMEIQKYIAENKLIPITSMYIVTLKEVTKPEEI
ncbi:hypothetical protein [Hathewaya proteolytica]|nr:hypothetical protein [Hathewaya proteolytica]